MCISGRIELVEPIGGRKQMNASELPLEVWTKIAAQLRERWNNEKDKDEKHRLGESLKAIYASRFWENQYLPFLRERITTAHADFVPTYTSELFEALLSHPWTDALEAEAFAVLEKLNDRDEPVARLFTQVPALYRLVDAMLANRTTASEAALGDSGDTTKLTRPELAAKRAELRKSAMQALADRPCRARQGSTGPARAVAAD